MSEAAFILIIEDEARPIGPVLDDLRAAGHLCRVVSSNADALESARAQRPDVILADVAVSVDGEGLNWVPELNRLAPDAEIVLIRSESDSPEMPEGARVFGVIERPAESAKMRDLIEQAVVAGLQNRHRRALREQADKRIEFDGIITINDKMVRVLRKLERAAESKLTVLILGESGTGKELAAQAVHRHSPRCDRPYRAINCAGLNENLLESELFGHVKGAFTGAISDRKGLFEVVDGGTLFLDEVGDMPLPMQAKLLRTLEGGEILPVGSNDIRKVDVRVVAATRQDVRGMVESGEFRDDLFYRLNQAVIRIPPLRERREDIPLLIDHFIQEAAAKHGKKVESITPEAGRKLAAFGWPGNVRELRSTIEAMVVYAESDALTFDDLPENIRGSTDLAVAGFPTTAGLTMEQMEKFHIANTLKLTSGNREKTAKMLGIGARTLYRKLKEYDLQ